MFPGAFQNNHLLVMDPYDPALTNLKSDSDKDFQDVLQLAEKVPFDIDLFERRYQEELRDNTTGKPEDNDRTFYRWKEAILEDCARRNGQSTLLYFFRTCWLFECHVIQVGTLSLEQCATKHCDLGIGVCRRT